jgi:alpha-aminoadipate/glutamate carrier protein LysW
VVRCPECGGVLDLEEDEVEEGEILSCPECEVELEIISVSPVQVNALSDDEDEAEEEEEEDVAEEKEEKEEEEEDS